MGTETHDEITEDDHDLDRVIAGELDEQEYDHGAEHYTISNAIEYRNLVLTPQGQGRIKCFPPGYTEAAYTFNSSEYDDVDDLRDDLDQVADELDDMSQDDMIREYGIIYQHDPDNFETAERTFDPEEYRENRPNPV